MRSGLVSKVSKLVISNAISCYPFNNGDRFYNACSFTSVRGHAIDVTVEHFSRGRSTRSKKWAKRGDRARKRRIDDHRSNRRSYPGASSPWTGWWGLFHPCLGLKLSPLIGLCAPWRHRATGVTYNFKHAELWIQSVDWYSPYRTGLTLRIDSNLKTDRQTPFWFHCYICTVSFDAFDHISERWVVLTFNVTDVFLSAVINFSKKIWLN